MDEMTTRMGHGTSHPLSVRCKPTTCSDFEAPLRASEYQEMLAVLQVAVPTKRDSRCDISASNNN
jgi:hypothetical protein